MAVCYQHLLMSIASCSVSSSTKSEPSSPHANYCLGLRAPDRLRRLWRLAVSSEQSTQSLTQVFGSRQCSVARLRKRSASGSQVCMRHFKMHVLLRPTLRPLAKVWPLAIVLLRAKPARGRRAAAASMTSQNSEPRGQLVIRMARNARCQCATFLCVVFRARTSRGWPLQQTARRGAGRFFYRRAAVVVPLKLSMGCSRTSHGRARP